MKTPKEIVAHLERCLNAADADRPEQKKVKEDSSYLKMRMEMFGY